MRDVSAIVLAAGLGRRFGGSGQGGKVLARLAGRPLVVHAASTAAEAGIADIVVVAGSAHHALAALLVEADLPSVRTVRNEAAASGMAGSLRMGVESLAPGCRAVFVMLADMPCVMAATLIRLLAAFDEEQAEAAIPEFGGRRGNPVLIGRALFPALLRLTGDEGAKRLLGERTVARVPVDDPGVLVDIDTREALRALDGRCQAAAAL